MVATSTAAAGVHGFTVEHVRMLVDPSDAQTAALALGAGVLPYREGDSAVDKATQWFGRSLVPLNAGVRALDNQYQYQEFRATVQALDTRTNQVPVCTLDLLRIRHTHAARVHGADGGSTLFGAATLNTSTRPGDVRFSLGSTVASYGQIRTTFTAANSNRPSPALTTLTRTLDQHIMLGPPTYALADIIGEREGVESSLKVTKAKTVATYEPDIASIWSITPNVPGRDIIFDTFHLEYADTPVYRVFETAPAPRRTR